MKSAFASMHVETETWLRTWLSETETKMAANARSRHIRRVDKTTHLLKTRTYRCRAATAVIAHPPKTECWRQAQCDLCIAGLHFCGPAGSRKLRATISTYFNFIGKQIVDSTSPPPPMRILHNSPNAHRRRRPAPRSLPSPLSLGDRTSVMTSKRQPHPATARVGTANDKKYLV